MLLIQCTDMKLSRYLRNLSCSCVAPSEKFHALILAENMMSILGEKWLIGGVKLPNVDLPADR